MKKNSYLTKITDNTKFIKELDDLLKDSVKASKIANKNSSFNNSFVENLIEAINSQLDNHSFFKNFHFLENSEFDYSSNLLITSKLPSKIYKENLESITISFAEKLDSSMNNNYFISEISIKKTLNNSIGEHVTYTIHNIDCLNWVSLETFNGSFSMHLANESYGFTTQTILDYNETGDIVDFVGFVEDKHHENTKEIATILNKAFFEEESLSKEKIEYFLLTQDIDLSVINNISHLFINLDSFNLDSVYHNVKQNKKTLKHSK